MLELLTDPQCLGGARHFDRARDRARHRQRRLHLHPGVALLARSGASGAADRPLARLRLSHRDAVRPDLADEADLSAVLDLRHRHFLARHHPDRRRPVPDRQGDARNPRRSRASRARTAGQNAAAQSFALVVAQLVVVDLVFSLNSIITAIGMANGHRDHDRRGGDRDGGDVRRVRPGLGLHRRASDHQDAGAGVPRADRRGAGRRGLRLPYPARLHLLRHGVRRPRSRPST